MQNHRGNEEQIVLETQGLLIKNLTYHAVLTDHRIILTGNREKIPRTVYLTSVEGYTLDNDISGDPVLLLSVRSASHEQHQVILHFPFRTFPNALQLRSLWSSEIDRRVSHPMPIEPVRSGQMPVFCSRCGSGLTGGSAFCDRCGAPVPDSSQDMTDIRLRKGKKGIPGTLPAMREDPSSAGRTRGNEKEPIITSRSPGRWNGSSVFLRLRTGKPVVIGGVIVFALVMLSAVVFMTQYAVVSPANLTSAAPDPGSVSEDAHETVAAPSSASAATSESQPAPGIISLTSAPEATIAHPAITSETGDPGAVLATYPMLFNSEDGNGLWALLGEDVRAETTVDDLNNELDVARTNGNSIDSIQVHNQVIDGNAATLIADIVWKTSESPVTQTQNLQLIREGGQWKLNTLILHP